MIVLQILGGMVLGVIFLGVLIYLYFRFKFGKYLHMEKNQEPLTISLVEDVSPEWLNDKKATKLAQEFTSLGYTEGTAYTIYEMDDFSLKSYFKPPFLGVVYMHKVAGVWCDVALTNKLSLSEYTFTTAPMGAGLDERPECNKTFKPEATVTELNNLAERIVDGRESEFLVTEDNGFRDYFEGAYKKDIAWKHRKGGITYEEFIKVGEGASISTSEKVNKDAFVQTKLDELYLWHEAALDEYRKSQNISKEDFYEISFKLIVVPFYSNAKAFIEYLESLSFISEEQFEKLAKYHEDSTDIYSVFQQVNNLYPSNLQAEYLTDGDFPLKLKVYKMPDQMFESDYMHSMHK